MLPFINLNSITRDIKLQECRIENINSFELHKEKKFLQRLRKRVINTDSIKDVNTSKTIIIDSVNEHHKSNDTSI